MYDIVTLSIPTVHYDLRRPPCRLPVGIIDDDDDAYLLLPAMIPIYGLLRCDDHTAVTNTGVWLRYTHLFPSCSMIWFSVTTVLAVDSAGILFHSWYLDTGIHHKYLMMTLMPFRLLLMTAWFIYRHFHICSDCYDVDVFLQSTFIPIRYDIVCDDSGNRIPLVALTYLFFGHSLLTTVAVVTYWLIFVHFISMKIINIIK